MLCPNINSREWKNLESAVGKRKAYSIFINNGYDIPSDEVIQYLKQAKVSEKELAWIKGKLPNGLDMTIFEILAQQTAYGNQYVWGQFKNNTLNISRLSEKGTGYHEYFHAIFRNYFAQEEIDAYLQEAANEIDRLLDRDGKSIKQYIAEKQSTFIEQGLTTQEKVDLLYEEYLADNFAKFMNKKESNNVFQKLFQILKDFIDFVFNNQRQLDLLFHKISNSDYRNQRIALNKYQEGYLQDQAYVRKIYKEPIYTTDDVIKRSFGIEESQQIVRDIGKIYYSLKNSDFYSKNKFTPDELLDKAMETMMNYSNDSKSDWGWALDPDSEIVDDASGETEYNYIRNTVKSFIKSISPYFAFNEDILVDEQEQDVDDNDDPLSATQEQEEISPRDDSFGKESAEKQGWSRLPQFLREYISTSSYLEVGEDGNPILIANIQLSETETLPIYKEKTINVNKIYFSLTRSLIDTPSDVNRLAKMYSISRSNSNQKAFVDRFFKDSNLDPSRISEMLSTNKYISRRADGSFTLKDITLIQAVLKGFDKYTQDPLMMAIDTTKRKTTVALANRNNASIIFYDQWQSNFESLMYTGDKFNSTVWGNVFTQQDAIIRALSPNVFISEQDISNKAELVINQLSRLGIDLSQGYVEYSIAANLKAGNKLGDSAEARKIKNKLSNIKLPKENVLSERILRQIFSSIAAQDNPFQVVETSDGEADSGGKFDARQRIQAIAKGNVKFDEAAYETSYISSDGTMRYGHQDATLHLTEVSKLNDASYLDKVLSTGIRDEQKGTVINGTFYQTDMEDADFRINSLFNQLDNGISKLLANNQEINFILRPADGIKEDALGVNDEGQTRRMTFVKKGESEGVHFGDMTDRDFATYMLNLTLESYETQDIVNDKGDTTERVYFSPVSLGMMETSKTHHFMYLPMLRNLYTKEGMTNNSKDLLFKEIEKEYNRIRRVGQQLTFRDKEGNLIRDDKGQPKFKTLDELEAEQALGIMPFIYSNYHIGKRRALEFSDFNSGFISKEIQQLLIDNALNNNDITDLTEQVKESIVNQFEGEGGILDQHLKELEATGVIYQENGKFKSELLSKNFLTDLSEEDQSKLDSKGKLQVYANIINGFKANLAHIILNQHLNSVNALHIMNGDPALMYKNDQVGTDFYKRMKTSNGAGVSASHNHSYLDKPDGFERFNAIVLQEPKVNSKYTGQVKKNDDGSSTYVADKIDVADAQMYMNIKALKHVLLGFGKLNEKTADLIVNKIEKGIPLSNEDLFQSGVVIEQDRFINPYKFIFRDPSSTKKISAFILTRNLVETNIGTEENPDWRASKDRTELHEIYSLMNDKNIDFAVFETGSKTMTANVLRKKNGKYDASKAYPISYNADYLRLQLENPTNKTHITSPTQLIQQVDTEQDLNAKGYIAGQEKTIGAIRNDYNKALKDKHDANYIVARNTMYTIDSMSRDLTDSIKQGIIVPKLAEFQERSIKGLLESGADSQLVDFFRTTVDADGNVVPQFDLNNPKTIEKYVNLWYSTLSKGVYSMKNTGYAAALVSSYGFTPIKKIKEITKEGNVIWEVIRKNSPEYKNLHRNNDLVINQITYSDEKTFQVLGIGDDTIDTLRAKLADPKSGPIYFKDRLQYGVPRYENGVVTGYFAEILFPNHHPDLIDDGLTIPNEIKYMFGNRIPLQDKHSMMNFELVDFLPTEYGSSLVAPQEIVEFSGADYDIDKVYITAPPVYFENGKPVNYHLGNDINIKYKEYKHWMSTEAKDVKKRMGRGVSIEEALASLGLPSSLKEYEEYLKKGELNNGVNERIIFESMTTLYSNQSMIDRKIPMAPANQEKLKDLQFLKEDPDNPDQPYFKKGDIEIFSRKLTNPALTPLQLWRAKRANNIGKDNIGIIVNLNKVFTTLNKAQATIPIQDKVDNRIHYNGKIYDDFSKWTSEDGERIIDYLSTLTSAATDEAKDSNCAKFGLGIEEMKAAGVLLGLGMPIADVIVIVNQPIIKAYTKLIADEKNAIETKEEQNTSLSTEQKIEAAFELVGATREETKEVTLDPKVLSEILFGNLDKTFSAQQSAAIELFQKALKLNEIFSAVATVMKLTNGIDYNSIDNIKRAKKTLGLGNPKQEEMISGIRYALTGDDRYQANNDYVNELASANLKNLEEIEKLNKITFLTKAPAFQRVLSEIGRSYHSVSTEDRKQFEKDLLSYLILQTYKSFHFPNNGNSNYRTGFIYDVSNKDIKDFEGIKLQNITEKLADVKQKIATNPEYADLKNNPLMTQLLAKSAKAKIKGGNTQNLRLEIYEIITRTTSKKNELQQGEMTLGFLELLEDPRTEDFALALLDFELVKDGLQFQFQTIGSIFPVDMYKESLGFTESSLQFVRKFMNASTKDDYQQVVNMIDPYTFDVDKIDLNKNKLAIKDDITKVIYGMSYNDFINDFYRLKFTNAKSFKRIKKIKIDKATLVKDGPIRLDLAGGRLLINLKNGIAGLKGEAYGKKLDQNRKIVGDAKFFNVADKVINYPRYVKSTLKLGERFLPVLFEYQENLELKAKLETVQNDISELADTIDPEQLKQLEKLEESIQDAIREKALYKVVNVVGSPKVAPWLNPVGIVPTATAYKKQDQFFKKMLASKEVPVVEEATKEEPFVDIVIPDFVQPEIETPEVKGPIESSMDEETKDILSVDNIKLNYGTRNIDDIINNLEC